MKPLSPLNHAEQQRIWQVQLDIGISPSRLAHVRKTVEFLGKLRRGKVGAFYCALLPENRRYEDRKAYLSRINWVQEKFQALDATARGNLDAGMRLHDIGYAVTPGGNHPEEGYLLLRRDAAIWAKLGLPPSINKATIELITKYHGFFTDIGFLYPAELTSIFSPDQKAMLAVVSALDSTAKPIGDKFHSILFSRLLERYSRFSEEGAKLDRTDRLRQLFGPCNYVWLETKDLTALDKAIAVSGLDKMAGFAKLVDEAYFWCWPLIKDLVAERVEISGSYYVPVNQEYLPQLVNLLVLLAGVVEKTGGAKKLVVDTEFNYVPLASRPLILEKLRTDLGRVDQRLTEIKPDTFVSGENLVFKVWRQEDTVVIKIALLNN